MRREPTAGERRAIELARDIPVEPLGGAQRDSIRAAILAAAEDEVGPARRVGARRRPMVAMLAAAAGVAIVAGAGLWWARGKEPARGAGRADERAAGGVATYRATINARAGAEVARLSAVPDERVRLTTGLVTIDVRPLGAGERFRVVIGDAEVEVRGTSFDVRAEHDQLVEVVVHHGIVEVRPAGRPAVLLRAGDRWSAEQLAGTGTEAGTGAATASADLRPQAGRAVASRATAPAAPAESMPRPAARTAPPAEGDVNDPTPQPEAERAFEDAWEALRAGETDRAIAGFHAAAAAAEGDALAEDATFWHAVALARAGRRAAATTALRDFLARFPASPRAGEASAILGWQLLEAGDLDAAEPVFRAAAADPAPAIAESGRKGLAEILRRR